MIERENGKKHGRCKYCGILKKNEKSNGKLLKHLTKPQQWPDAPREVLMSLRSPSTPKPTSAPGKIAPSPSDELNQDDFEMALARVCYVCALSFMLVEAQIFRDFIAMVAPTMKLSGILLKRLRDEIHANVIKLINKQSFVSLVTDGWSDTNGSGTVNVMVVAAGLPSLFWSSWSTRSEQHIASYLAGEIDASSRILKCHNSTSRCRCNGQRKKYE
ncbi:unnamed protein product [Phytophthora fragariaefolia]|uniref:Unnamed protein product n=1 Tax=Phytophthora fragariaefolia TaxID=1490495 RepID=A0A9W7CZD5_9STRA|nr:unnamed protein product [Phytophthora fragariaefolia]